MSTNWFIFVQIRASVGALLALTGTSILMLTKENNMIKTIAKAIILTVGTTLLGWPIWTACFQLQRGECPTGAEDAI
jgi:hypothetical protein